jgi:hypothetical protein
MSDLIWKVAMIPSECQTENESCRPIFVPEDSPDLAKWPALRSGRPGGWRMRSAWLLLAIGKF